jgi:hypothetical protein
MPPVSKQIPLPRALAYISLSLLLISGSATLFLHREAVKGYFLSASDCDHITALVHVCDHGCNLPTSYLAELLELSVDMPTAMRLFDLKMGKERLLRSPLIVDAVLKKIPPSTLYIRYATRQPIAYLVDYSNSALDVEGFVLPFKPFFTPKKMATVYLGMGEGAAEPPAWGTQIQGARWQLARRLLQGLPKLFVHLPISVIAIDVARAFAPSNGEREIVIVIGEASPDLPNGFVQRTLRLDIGSFRRQLVNYLSLRPYLQGETLIDMRISQLAFIGESE